MTFIYSKSASSFVTNESAFIHLCVSFLTWKIPNIILIIMINGEASISIRCFNSVRSEVDDIQPMYFIVKECIDIRSGKFYDVPNIFT